MLGLALVMALGRLVLSMVDEATGVLGGMRTELAGVLGAGAEATGEEDWTGTTVSTVELCSGVVATGVLCAGVVSTMGVEEGVAGMSEIVTAGTVMVDETVVVETVL